jgi:hypothetical protein
VMSASGYRLTSRSGGSAQNAKSESSSGRCSVRSASGEGGPNEYRSSARCDLKHAPLEAVTFRLHHSFC